jgi:surfactin family lipopeptide synthetase A/fengycin family lipopeptide synthetase D
VLRIRLDGNPSFRRILHTARTTTLDALNHQTLPFEQLVEHLRPERALNHTPLFQTILNFQNTPLTPPRFDGLEPSHHEVHLEIAKFDLLLEVTPHNRSFDLSAEYSIDLFDTGTVERLLGHLETLLAGAVSNPEEPLARLPLLTPEQRRLVLFDWNRTQHDYSRNRCIHELFEEKARQRPDAPALLSSDGATTYAELNCRANRLALALRRRGAQPGRTIAVQLRRSPELVCALLAVLKSGAAYVPLDPALPSARAEAVLRACDAQCLITECAQLAGASQPGSPLSIDAIILDRRVSGPYWRLQQADEGVAIRERSVLSPARAAEPSDIAYVIFTSGSTGTPKGVLLQHEAVVNTIDWVNRTFEVGPGDRLLFVTAPMFDLSVYDIFGVLAAGGSIRIACEDELEEPARLARILREEPITFWDSAPAALQQLVPFFPSKRDRHTSLRLVFLSGDWIPLELPETVRTAFPTARVVGLGGATEAAIWSNYHEIGELDPCWVSVPYGRPIQNAQYYVLDDGLEPVPIGTAGELFIGGACVAAGYLRQPELTAERFVPDPFGDAPGARLYRTRDRARYHADGCLEFLGRLDNQLKIRGYRVEPAEIESALRRHPQVAEAIVTAEPGPQGSARLTAYVAVSNPADPPTAHGLRNHLHRHLPRYMHPSRYCMLDQLPLTANGKLDRARLPASAATAPLQIQARTQTERRLADIWAVTLERDVVGIGDNFFELGGHSLSAVRVVSEVAAAFGIQLSLRTVFEAQTLAELGERVDELRARGDGACLASIDALPRDRYSIASRLLLNEAQQ